jgi:hypothetical protein
MNRIHTVLLLGLLASGPALVASFGPPEATHGELCRRIDGPSAYNKTYSLARPAPFHLTSVEDNGSGQVRTQQRAQDAAASGLTPLLPMPVLAV